ncbi:hypothetical protein HMH01_04590 [Halovulum dunhuangense]|uniref:Uncharacterized protein n=1 Tax=Halovulum dunhuangense TaxID=1505036 RepID=A0A849L0C6_9RHOB|nr:hypothetical protein [Halovulum dunhuangense]NNU79714.1 hypothetical protein [Halovulum dunhuangense]
MIRATALIALCLVVPACAAPLPDGRSQLAASLGLTAEQEAGLTVTQIALIKHAMDSSQFSADEKNRRIEAILAGASPILEFGF